MEKVFAAVMPNSESEKYVVGLTGQFGSRSSVMLGALVGWEANFYEFSGMTHDDADFLARDIATNCGPGIFRVTRSDEESYELADFVRHATEE